MANWPKHVDEIKIKIKARWNMSGTVCFIYLNHLLKIFREGINTTKLFIVYTNQYATYINNNFLYFIPLTI